MAIDLRAMISHQVPAACHEISSEVHDVTNADLTSTPHSAVPSESKTVSRTVVTEPVFTSQSEPA